jgi:hypothetical protein
MPDLIDAPGSISVCYINPAVINSGAWKLDNEGSGSKDTVYPKLGFLNMKAGEKRHKLGSSWNFMGIRAVVSMSG